MDEIRKLGGEATPEDVDAWLRRHLAPSPEQVDRVVRRALSVGRAVPAPTRVSLRTTTLAAVLAGVLAVLLALALMRSDREILGPPRPFGGGSGSPGVAAVITNRSGRVELRLPAGAELRPSTGAAGARPEEIAATIFNRGGLVAARVTDGGVRYMVIGGAR